MNRLIIQVILRRACVRAGGGSGSGRRSGRGRRQTDRQPQGGKQSQLGRGIHMYSRVGGRVCMYAVVRQVSRRG